MRTPLAVPVFYYPLDPAGVNSVVLATTHTHTRIMLLSVGKPALPLSLSFGKSSGGAGTLVRRKSSCFYTAGRQSSSISDTTCVPRETRTTNHCPAPSRLIMRPVKNAWRFSVFICGGSSTPPSSTGLCGSEDEPYVCRSFEQWVVCQPRSSSGVFF